MLSNRNEALRGLPAVHRLLGMAESESLFHDIPQWLRIESVRLALDDLRAAWDNPETPPDEAWWRVESEPAQILKRAQAYARRRLMPHLRPVLNLTGTVIHTNLGRAPLSASAVEAVRRVAAGYSNLEYDLETGERGTRHAHVESLLCELTGAESAVVVNNNAAAAWLVLRTMAAGGEGIVSRGQLVEIGGSFRIPDIMRESGVDLIEVGTTNKTRLRDYEQAMSERSRVVLKVHTSNFRIVGFTEQPDLRELVELAHRNEIPVYEDLGSGALFDYAKHGVGDEPTVRNSVECGVDVVTYSGDKLLGGAQAGIIVGRESWLALIRQHPLMRALRVDKMTLAALEATLRTYLDESQVRLEIPVVRMLTETYDEIASRCDSLYERMKMAFGTIQGLHMDMSDDVSRIGGGALPEESLPTRVIRVSHDHLSAQGLLDRLRTTPDIPVIARIAKGAVLLDVRTLLPGQESLLLDQLHMCFFSVG